VTFGDNMYMPPPIPFPTTCRTILKRGGPGINHRRFSGFAKPWRCKSRQRSCFLFVILRTIGSLEIGVSAIHSTVVHHG